MANFPNQPQPDQRRDGAAMECEAFRALLLGVCQNLQAVLKKVDSYEELLLDELESKGCDTTYLLQEQGELRNVARLADNVLETIPAVGDEQKIWDDCLTRSQIEALRAEEQRILNIFSLAEDGGGEEQQELLRRLMQIQEDIEKMKRERMRV